MHKRAKKAKNEALNNSVLKEKQHDSRPRRLLDDTGHQAVCRAGGEGKKTDKQLVGPVAAQVVQVFSLNAMGNLHSGRIFKYALSSEWQASHTY